MQLGLQSWAPLHVYVHGHVGCLLSIPFFESCLGLQSKEHIKSVSPAKPASDNQQHAVGRTQVVPGSCQPALEAPFANQVVSVPC